VDEKGTEAAAVTVVAVMESAGPTRHIKYMFVDRPFLCVIRENQSQSILFIGKIETPTWYDN
jgi:serpin B